MCSVGSIVGAIGGFLVGGPVGAVYGYSAGQSYDAMQQAKKFKSDQEAALRQQQTAMAKQQAELKARQAKERNVADASIVRARARAGGAGASTAGGTLLTGPSGVADTQLNLGKTMLGQ